MEGTMKMSSSSKYKIGYKVLSKERLSIIMSCHTCAYYKAYVTYPVNKEVKPKPHYGPLCVFKHLNYANAFKNTSRKDSIIVKCKYKPSKSSAAHTINHKIVCPIESLPKGTVLADSVTCLE